MRHRSSLEIISHGVIGTDNVDKFCDLAKDVIKPGGHGQFLRFK